MSLRSLFPKSAQLTAARVSLAVAGTLTCLIYAVDLAYERFYLFILDEDPFFGLTRLSEGLAIGAVSIGLLLLLDRVTHSHAEHPSPTGLRRDVPPASAVLARFFSILLTLSAAALLTAVILGLADMIVSPIHADGEVGLTLFLGGAQWVVTRFAIASWSFALAICVGRLTALPAARST